MHIKNQSTRNGLHKNSNKVLGEFSLLPEENNYTYSISEKQFSMLKGNKNILNH